MHGSDYIAIPLRRRDGSIRAYAKIDHQDVALAGYLWHMDRDGYARRNGRIEGRRISVLMHREILGLSLGDPRQGDHINRSEKLDNRRSNLRIVTHAQNAQNVGGLPLGTSRYRGVTWHKKTSKWQARAMLNGERHYLGTYATEEEAAAVARRWRLEHMTHTNEVRDALV